MTETEKLLMVYGSAVYCRMQYLYDETVTDLKKANVLAGQINILQGFLERLPFEDVLQCGQKDFYSFL